ncbi:MAG: hypothetical protein Q9159_004025 [Coniocarpon cinnabarinum]
MSDNKDQKTSDPNRNRALLDLTGRGTNKADDQTYDTTMSEDKKKAADKGNSAKEKRSLKDKAKAALGGGGGGPSNSGGK